MRLFFTDLFFAIGMYWYIVTGELFSREQAESYGNRAPAGVKNSIGSSYKQLCSRMENVASLQLLWKIRGDQFGRGNDER